jgi:RNA polymerase sigma-70 factor (ECF subfamily)
VAVAEAAAEVRGGAVGGDPVQPGGELGVAPEAADAAEGAEVGLLHHVSGVVLVPDDGALDPLVRAARDGDRHAFEQLVRATASDTYSLAHRLVGDEDDARDVVQEVYLRAFRGIQRFRGDAQFSTWLHRITANCAATHLGRRRRHRHDELADDDVPPDEHPGRSPELVAESHALRDRLTVELAALPPRLRAVVVLRDVYDLPHEAIAAELGISVSAAKVRLHRARKRLRERLFPLPGEEGAAARAV